MQLILLKPIDFKKGQFPNHSSFDGQSNSKTTEIYSHGISVSCKNEVSALDQITELLNLKSETAAKLAPHKMDIHNTGERS